MIVSMLTIVVNSRQCVQKTYWMNWTNKSPMNEFPHPSSKAEFEFLACEAGGQHKAWGVSPRDLTYF
jgi:hypothetical protein